MVPDMTPDQMAQRRAEEQAIAWLHSQGWRAWICVPGGGARVVAVRYPEWALIVVRRYGFGDLAEWNRLWTAAEAGSALALWRTHSGWWQILGPSRGPIRPMQPWGRTKGVDQA